MCKMCQLCRKDSSLSCTEDGDHQTLLDRKNQEEFDGGIINLANTQASELAKFMMA